MDVIKKWISTLYLLFLLAVSGKCFAQNKPNAPGNQRVQFYFDEPVTLDSLTRYVHSRSKIRFSFNSSKVKGNKVIHLKKGTYTIDLLLQQIQKNTSLYYSTYNGYVIFQDNPPKQRKAPPKKKPTPLLKKEAAHKTITPEPIAKTEPQPVVAKDTVIKKDTTFILVSPVTKNQPVANDSTHKKVITLAFIPAKEDRPLVIEFGDTSVVKKQTTTPNREPAPVAVKPAKAAAVKKHERITIARARSSNYGRSESRWQWQFGLQWKAAIPLYSTQHYFTGTNTRNESYNLLIPGVWVSAMANAKHEIMLLVKPAEWYFYNKKAFRTDSGFIYRNFDSIAVITNTRLVKTGGWYGSLQYNYHINENWVVGAGIGYHLRSGGLAYTQSYKRSVDSLVADSLYSIKNGTDTKYLSSSFISGKLELAYRFNTLDLGATLLMPLTDPFAGKSLNKSRPLNLQLFLRWRIKRRDEE